MSNNAPAVDDDVQRLAHTARSLVWALRRFGEREAGLARLPQSEIDVLRAVEENPGSTVSEIARFLGLQSSNVSTTVRNLVERGLVERRLDPEDRRSHRLHLTALSERNRRLIDEMWNRGIRNLLNDMSPDDAARLVEAAPLLARLGSMPID
ncbi:MAG: MarR family transcriptional regulator [Rhodococcus sp. (in: high G+C Gram-positive bacteria)]|uniref:MarR family winged helix-turn-helix transcriptional regulator n=1 Tax=Rhodococcus sp. TaxID=1831 RepID=UPI003BB0AB59